MHRQRLEQLISAYGANPARWPARERVSASELDALGPDFASLLEAERQLDGRLDELPPVPAASSALAARIRAVAPGAPLPRWSWRALLSELGGPRLAAPALACALSLGLGLAVLLPATPAADEPGLDTWVSLALLDEGLDEELLP